MRIKLKSILTFILLIIASLLMGYIFGKSEVLTSLGMSDLLLFLLSFPIAFILHLFIHELGHLVFGKISGLDFYSFRIFKWTLIKEDSKIKVKEHRVSGTLGQCIMTIPESSHVSFTFYLLGGILMNLILSILSLLLINQFPVFIFAFFIVGILMILTQGIPHGFNDGMTLKLLGQNQKNKDYLTNQLNSVSLLAEGKTFTDFPAAFFDVEIEALNENYLTQFQFFLLISRLFQEEKYEQALELMNQEWERKQLLILPYYLNYKKYYLFLATLLREQSERLDMLNQDKQLENYMREKSAENKMIEATKIWIKELNPVSALEKLDEAENLIAIIPYKGERIFMQQMIDSIRNKIFVDVTM